MEVIRGKNYRIEWRGNEFLLDFDRSIKGELEEKLAKLVETQAKQLCPVGTVRRNAGKFKEWASREPGRLRDSIRAMKSKFRGGGWIVLAGGYLPFYAFMVETGKGGVKGGAQPYLRPATEIARTRLPYFAKRAAKKCKFLKAA